MQLNDQIAKNTFDPEIVTYQTYFLYDDDGNFVEGKNIASNEKIPENATTQEPTKKVGDLVAMMVKPVFKKGKWVETANANDMIDSDTALRIEIVKQVAELQSVIKQQSVINANLTKELANIKQKEESDNG